MNNSRRAFIASLGMTATAGCSTIREVTGYQEKNFIELSDNEISQESWPRPGRGPQNKNSIGISIPEEKPNLEWKSVIEESPMGWMSVPLIDSEIAIVGTNNSLIAFSAVNGEKQWSTRLGSNIFVSPTIIGQTIYTGSKHGIHAFSLSNGDEKWHTKNTELPGGNNELYTARAPVVADASLVVATSNYILCLDAEGKVKWWLKTDASEVFASPAVENSTVFVIKAFGPLMAFNLPVDPWGGILDRSRQVPIETGLKWRKETGEEGGPIVGNDLIYQPQGSYSDGETGLAAYDIDTGEPQWHIQTKTGHAMAVLIDDTLFVYDASGWLYSVDATTGETEWSKEVDPGADDNARQLIAGEDGVIIPTVSSGIVGLSFDGSRKWRIPEMRPLKIALAENRIYVALERDEYYEVKCYT